MAAIQANEATKDLVCLMNINELDEAVIRAFPIPGSTLVEAVPDGKSLWCETARLIVKLPNGETDKYLLKTVHGDTGKETCEGYYESLAALYEVSPEFIPRPYAWGKFHGAETYFLLEEFRTIGTQPAEPGRLSTRLANLHLRSVSPTGKFGFHVRTYHTLLPQAVDVWDSSWSAVFSRHFAHIVASAAPILRWPEFELVARLTLEKVVPRLLLPLQSEGRAIKPCLVHGHCWDGNTAMDMSTGEAFVLDPCSFYAHNEYDLGNWRSPRHRLSFERYKRAYKQLFPPSEPAEDWDARNLLYSLPFNIITAVYLPGSNQRPEIYEDMTTLCNMFCPEDLLTEMSKLKTRMMLEREISSRRSSDLTANTRNDSPHTVDGHLDEEEEEEGEEEEEEEELDDEDM